jgi:glycosyltransferase involved in cell wall biosynthesis
MTIRHIIPDNELGGGTVNAARLMRALAARPEAEAQSVLLPADARPEARAVFRDLPCDLGRFRGRGSVFALARAISDQAGAGDVIHAHGTRGALGAMLAGAARPDLRLLYNVRGFHGLAQPGPLALRARLERLLARRMHATVFVSHADAALAERSGLRFRGLARVIENGLETPRRREESPKDLDLLFIGRLVHQKWPEAFLETLARCRRPRSAAMIGSGELENRVAELARRLDLPRLERAPGLPHAEALDRMARARIVVMTSRWEGLPTVAIEALQSRALVAGFDIPPLAEVVGEAREAVLTPADPSALAARLDSLLDDDASRLGLARRLHDRARDRYDPARMAARYAKVYAALRD